MRFLKSVLRPTEYHPRDSFTGERRKETFTAERISKLASRMKEMLDAGLNIYCPFRHNGSIPLADRNSSKDNAGFWSQPLVGLDGALYSEVEVPLDDDSKRFGTTIKEVSPFIATDWKDGNGRTWPGESILHIAAVTHPVDRNQENFIPVSKESPYSVALSDFELAENHGQEHAPSSGEQEPPSEPAQVPGQGTTAAGCSVADALVVLSRLGLTLPQDTNEQNLIERICVAGNAVASSKKTDESSQEQPVKTVEQPTPIAMGDPPVSTETPATTFESPIALADDHPVMKLARKQLRAAYKTRINALLSTGRCSKDYAKKWLMPFLTDNGFQLSLDPEGTPLPTELDARLEALEALPQFGAMSGSPVTGDGEKTKIKGFPIILGEEPNPWESPEGGNKPTMEQVDEVLDKQFENIGRTDLIRKKRITAVAD